MLLQGPAHGSACHSLSSFFKSPRYNRDILIAGNAFRNPHGDADAAAIDVRNAEDVRIVDNRFEGFTKPVLIDGQVVRSESPANAN